MAANKQNDEYFTLAKDWHFERLEIAQLNATRWFICFIVACILIISLTCSIIIMTPLKTIVPLIIHQNTITGESWVEKPDKRYVPDTDAQTQSDIVRYITSYESYTSADLNQRFHLIIELSNNNVRKEYADLESNNNKNSPVNLLGMTGIRTVHIEDIVFIDKENNQEPKHFNIAPQNLAKVDFTTDTTDQNGTKKTESWVATISWVYKGLPQNQQEAWDNWDGFLVTAYRVDQRNLDN